MTRLHVVLPNDIDDPATPSGGNRYDRRVLDGLAAAGWSIREHPVYGTWPQPTSSYARSCRLRVRRVIHRSPGLRWQQPQSPSNRVVISMRRWHTSTSSTLRWQDARIGTARGS